MLDEDDNAPAVVFKLHSEAADTVDVSTRALPVEENRPQGSVVAVLNAKDVDRTPAFHSVHCRLTGTPCVLSLSLSLSLSPSLPSYSVRVLVGR